MTLPARHAVPPANTRETTRAESAYRRIKAAIFDFVLLPGEGFTESDMALRLECLRSRQHPGREWVANQEPG